MSRFDDRPFANLTPEIVLDALETQGFEPDGRLFALNSYENRVYQLGGTGGPWVLKFYRPQRWSDAQILEEHAFELELAAAELPVVAPLIVAERTLLNFQAFRFAVFPWHRGRAFDFDASDVLERLGRLLGRMHAIGRRARFRARPAISVQRLGVDAVRLVAASPLLPPQWAQQYSALSAQLLEVVARVFDEVQPISTLRLHGDCHLGNLLLDDGAPVFVDLDDCAQGPAIQDLWMLLSGSPDEQQGSWEKLIAGYEAFATFDYRELRLIEPLRALRMLHHTAWIVSRWQDPAFPRAFPSVVESRFWESHLQQLREQLAQLAEPPMLTR